MAYLMIDPCGQYPTHLMTFLGRLEQGAVAVFSSSARALLWRDKWSKELGHLALGTYVAPKYPSVEALARHIAQDWPHLVGVVPWDEESILLGAALGDRLGLGWNSLEVIERCRDKGVMKEWLRQHGGMRINAARRVTEASQALEFQRSLGRWPVVVKPTQGSGSTAVYFPTDDDALLTACQRVLEAGDGEVLLEEYIGGHELAVNGIVDCNGDLLVTDVWLYDRRTSHGVPNLYHQAFKLPSHHPVFPRLASYAADVVEALELKRAPIHMEVKVDDLGPCLIEVGARFAGGNLPVLASRTHGRSLFELAACHYIEELPLRGSDVNLERYDSFEARVIHGVQPVALQPIRAVHGVEAVRSLQSFAGFGILRSPGMSLARTTDLDTASYELYLIHRDPDQIALDARRVRRLLRYE